MKEAETPGTALGVGYIKAAREAIYSAVYDFTINSRMQEWIPL